MSLGLIGCTAETGAAAVAGGALSHTLAGVEADIAAEKERLLLESAGASELEKEILEKKIQLMEDLQYGIGIGKQAVETNWTDPEAVGGIAGTAIGVLAAWYFRNQNKTNRKKYEAHKVGAERVMRSNEKIASELYEAIGHEREVRGI